MKNAKFNMVLMAIMAICVLSCGRQKTQVADTVVQEDLKAKNMLQGVWLNADDEEPAMRVLGDTIFYPDSTSMPVCFQIYGDTIVLHGVNDVRYAIVRQSEHIFEFRNQNGDNVKFVKSDDEKATAQFETSEPLAINQNRLIKRDTIVMANGNRYHCYVQVNPTTYKVIKTTYNDDGVSVGNVYYDNIINLAVFQGTRRLYSSDFHKADFAQHVPEQFLKHSILSDMVFNRVDADGIHYSALICEPESPSSFEVDVMVSFDGRVALTNSK